MRPFSFVHAGDLHLDSPFKGLTAEAPQVARRLKMATFEAFEGLIALCVDSRVDFLLVAGDVYDAADRSVRAQLAFRDGLERLSANGIRTFLVHGNHDPLDGWADTIQWPTGVTVFGTDEPTTEIFEIEGVPVAAVSGISYLRQRETRNLARRFRARHPNLYQIALLHGNCGCNPAHEDYAPARLEELVASGFDYWALGHVHEQAVLSRDPFVVYPGNTQGRSIREQGPRGCFRVTVDGKRNASIDFTPLDVARWFTREIPIESLVTVDALDRKIADAVEDIRQRAGGRAAICRLVLTGRGTLSRDLRRDGVLADLLERVRETALEEPFVWVQEIHAACAPEIDLRKRSEADDFLGQVLRLALELEDSLPAEYSDNELPEPLRGALDDLVGARRFNRHAPIPDAEELRQIVRDAGLLCLDLLEPGE